MGKRLQRLQQELRCGDSTTCSSSRPTTTNSALSGSSGRRVLPVAEATTVSPNGNRRVQTPRQEGLCDRRGAYDVSIRRIPGTPLTLRPPVQHAEEVWNVETPRGHVETPRRVASSSPRQHCRPGSDTPRRGTPRH